MISANPRYIRRGECNQCGDCCRNERCEHFDGKICKIHNQERPMKCGNFPEAPPIIFHRCSYSFYDTWEDREVRGMNI